MLVGRCADQRIPVAVLLFRIHPPDYETGMGKVYIAILIFHPNWILKYRTFYSFASERIGKMKEKNTLLLMSLYLMIFRLCLDYAQQG